LNYIFLICLEDNCAKVCCFVLCLLDICQIDGNEKFRKNFCNCTLYRMYKRLILLLK